MTDVWPREALDNPAQTSDESLRPFHCVLLMRDIGKRLSLSPRKPTPELEQHFILKSLASVNVSIHGIRGRIIRYTRETDGAYEVTIQSKE